jgi:hypothetical protein
MEPFWGSGCSILDRAKLLILGCAHFSVFFQSEKRSWSELSAVIIHLLMSSLIFLGDYKILKFSYKSNPNFNSHSSTSTMECTKTRKTNNRIKKNGWKRQSRKKSVFLSQVGLKQSSNLLFGMRERVLRIL